MPVSEATYQRVALEDPEGHWELVCGRLREKPAMTTEHNQTLDRLDWALKGQLHPREYAIRESRGRLRLVDGSYFEPDLFVVPMDLVNRLREQPGRFEVFEAPMPLVVEVWSPSTGLYDATTKLTEYQRRGDQEIWLIHPYDRTLTAWRRGSDGSYSETVYRGGAAQPIALPTVTINLDQLFE